MGEMSRMRSRTRAEYSQLEKSISGKWLSAEIRDVMEVRTDFYSVLCVSVVSEPLGRRSMAWALLCKCFAAFGGQKWQMDFCYIFQM